MIVTCKVCNTRYSLNSDRIKNEQAKVRCSNCGEVFTVSKPMEAEAAPSQLLTDVFQEEEFGDEREGTHGREKKVSRRARTGRPLPRWSLVGLAIVLAAGIVFLLRGLFYTSSTQPEKIGPPPIASSEDPAIKSIILADAEGYFRGNKEAGTIFVIKGGAQNKGNQPFSFIRLRGLLHDANAQKVKEEEVFAGNVFTEEEITTLPMIKIRERSQNKQGLDNTNYKIPPGKTVPFMIVFDQIPPNLAEFTVRVVGGQSEPVSP
jgi:predicted Zn finger-like uncharacterized protein